MKAEKTVSLVGLVICIIIALLLLPVFSNIMGLCDGGTTGISHPGQPACIEGAR